MRLPSTKILSWVSLSFLLSNSYAQTPQQVENAIAFTKLYGYVKYFHPSDEAASIDWDRFAIYGMKRTSACANTRELQQTLSEIFKPIAPTLQLSPADAKTNFDKSILEVGERGNYKTIAWQHIGVAGTGRGDLYKSARTNRDIITIAKPPDFIPVSHSLSATDLQGKEFVFRGKMRLVSNEGQGQFWVRVDNANRGIGFFDNMNDRPVRSHEWASYEIRGKVDADASYMLFGAMLVGKGSVEFDDISLQVKDGNAWKEIYANSFTADKVGRAPQNWGYNNTAEYTIAVKKDDHDQAFVSIATDDVKPWVREHKTLFKSYPEVGEYIQKPIGGGLKMVLPLALYGSGTQTFPVADAALLQQLKGDLQNLTPATLTGNDLHGRLGDIAITWNVFQHFYPYFDVVKTDWNAALKKEAIAKGYSDKTEMDFLETLQQMTAKLKDGHVRVNIAGNKNVYGPPINWEWVEGELLITNVGDTTINLRRGDIVKEINGQTAKGYFSSYYSLISAGTNGWLQYRAQIESLVGEKGSMMKLKILHADQTMDDLQLVRNASSSQIFYSLRKNDSVKVLSDGMMYVNIDRMSMDKINKLLPQLKESKVIICDLRGYPNSNHDFIKYLLREKDTSKYWMQVAQVVYPDRERIAGWWNTGWELKPEKPHLDAKIIFLTDGSAISYAESFMGFIENYKLATIVGQPTAGTNGNVNTFKLPGGYSISWTGMKVQKHDGSTHHGVGIIPNILVNKTIKGVREGRDEFLEKAIEVGRSLSK